MGDRTEISWTDATWNWLLGCTRVSDGCVNCYAETMASRFSGPGKYYEGIAKRTKAGPRWTGKVVRAGAEKLFQPLSWTRPRMIFVNSMSDTFHEKVPHEWIDCAFAVMRLAPQHRYQVLTKRPDRARAYFTDPAMPDRVEKLVAAYLRGGRGKHAPISWVNDGTGCYLGNAWLGTSIENEEAARKRLPDLLQTPAAIRFVSLEPLLGPIDTERWFPSPYQMMMRCTRCHWVGCSAPHRELCPQCETQMIILGTRIDWAIVGGESGSGARPMHPAWPREIRDACLASGTPFHFKQWGAFKVGSDFDPCATIVDRLGRCWPISDREGLLGADPRPIDPHAMLRVGKHKSGRELDGQEWLEMPTEMKDEE